MGQAASILKAFSCESCAKYVCNAMDIKSKCCDCCDFEFQTDKVEVADDNSELSIEVGDCCELHDK